MYDVFSTTLFRANMVPTKETNELFPREAFHIFILASSHQSCAYLFRILVSTSPIPTVELN